MARKKSLTVRLPEELVDTLKEQAEAQAIPVTELVYRLLRQGLELSGELSAILPETAKPLTPQLHELESLLRDVSQKLDTIDRKVEHTGYQEAHTRGRCDTLEGIVKQVLVRHMPVALTTESSSTGAHLLE